MHNLDKSPLHVRHSELKRASEESLFRSECPACPKGVLLVCRDQTTYELLRDDRCVLCGQHVIYSDRDIAGQLLYPVQEAVP